MYDSEKAKELEKQSHVRGALSKEFYNSQQSQLEKKRRQMKRILDEQVEQRKRAKERQRQEQEKKQHKEEEEIKRYYEDVKQRQRRLSENSSNFNNSNLNGPKINSHDVTFNSPNDAITKKLQQKGQKLRVNSKTALQESDPGNIPLMPVMALSQGQMSYNRASSGMQYSSHGNNQQFYSNFDRENAGNIPLLDLSDQTYILKNKKKSKTQFKKQNTLRENVHLNQNQLAGAGSNVKLYESKHHQSFSNNMVFSQNNNSVESTKRKQRRKTMSDQDTTPLPQSMLPNTIINSRVSKASKFQQNPVNRSPSNTKRNTEMDIPEEIEQMQSENKLLKSELKKSQEAISLLIGAVRSNPKLDKFRVQAEKILHNAENNPKIAPNKEIKIVQKREESPLLLPKLKVKHQSIMHDYLLEAAKKARLKQMKSQTAKS